MLSSIFPEVPILAMTATANSAYKKEINDSLGMQNVTIVERNPDRVNIYLAVLKRPNTGDERVTAPIQSLAYELQEKKLEMPRTIVYGSLDVCGDCFHFFENVLAKDQYYPKDSAPTFDNRLFAQYHAQYPTKYKDSLVHGLVKGTSKARVIFVTVAFGVGVDCRDVEQVFHIGVPYNMEEFFQEIGRGGRDGSKAKSVLYYNGYDISKARRELSPIMREYATTTICRREIILQNFQARIPSYWKNWNLHECCDNCAKSFLSM